MAPNSQPISPQCKSIGERTSKYSMRERLDGKRENGRGVRVSMRVKLRKQETQIKVQGSGAELDVALGAADEGVKAGFVAALNVEVETDSFEGRGECLAIS